MTPELSSTPEWAEDDRVPGDGDVGALVHLRRSIFIAAPAPYSALVPTHEANQSAGRERASR